MRDRSFLAISLPPLMGSARCSTVIQIPPPAVIENSPTPWLKTTVASSSKGLATSGLDPAGVVREIARGNGAVAPDQADVARSRA